MLSPIAGLVQSDLVRMSSGYDTTPAGNRLLSAHDEQFSDSFCPHEQRVKALLCSGRARR
jgi:hypothetical protein